MLTPASTLVGFQVPLEQLTMACTKADAGHIAGHESIAVAMADVASSSSHADRQLPPSGTPSSPRHHRSSSHASTGGIKSPTTPTSGGHRLSHTQSNRVRGTLGTAGRPLHHRQALSAIRAFLRRESCFDILPESFRLIVFDNKLLIKRALVALQTNGVVSAPLYDSSNYRFAGMFTLVDVIHLIQYYYLTATGYDNAALEVEQVDLSALRDIEVQIDVPPPPIISVHPDDQLYTACAALVRTHARRLPLIDRDEQTGKETIVSVLTQYRVLKFLAINCREECSQLTESIGTLGIGTYISSFSPNGDPIQSHGTRPVQSSTGRRQRSRSYLPSSRQPGQAPYIGPSGPTHPEEGLPLDLDELHIPSQGSTSASVNVSSDPTGDFSEPTASTAGETTEPSTPSEQPPVSGAATPVTSTNPSSPNPADRFHPLATANLQTTVFDVVHLFSDLGISSVPIVDNETGQVINLYEAVDVVDLVRSNAYQVLDLTIEDALARRSKDFPGVVTCTPDDSLASILAYVREKRAHRFVIVEGEDSPVEMEGASADIDRPKKVPGRLLGVLCLSDILKYIVGSGSLAGVKVVGLGFRSEEEGLAIPRVVDDDELDELNEGVSGLGIQA